MPNDYISLQDCNNNFFKNFDTLVQTQFNYIFVFYRQNHKVTLGKSTFCTFGQYFVQLGKSTFFFKSTSM